MRSGRADSTTKKYLGAFQVEGMGRVNGNSTNFPVKGMHLALYVQHLNTAKHSRSAVEEVVHALAWVHKMAGIESPTESPLVQSVFEGLRRILSKPKVRKEPVSIEMLQAIAEAAGPAPSLSDVRLLAVCYLGSICWFLRCDELIKLRFKDVSFKEQGMVINIVSSKTDQYREGASLVIARTGTHTCPVSMMQKYFSMAGLSHTSDNLFRAIVSSKKGECLRKGGGLS